MFNEWTETSYGNEIVRVLWLPQAKKVDFMLTSWAMPRSYEKFIENRRKDVVSAYMGGNLICVTCDHQGHCYQIVFARDESKDLPPEMQRLLKDTPLPPQTPGSGFLLWDRATKWLPNVSSERNDLKHMKGRAKSVNVTHWLADQGRSQQMVSQGAV